MAMSTNVANLPVSNARTKDLDDDPVLNNLLNDVETKIKSQQPQPSQQQQMQQHMYQQQLQQQQHQQMLQQQQMQQQQYVMQPVHIPVSHKSTDKFLKVIDLSTLKFAVIIAILAAFVFYPPIFVIFESLFASIPFVKNLVSQNSLVIKFLLCVIVIYLFLVFNPIK